MLNHYRPAVHMICSATRLDVVALLPEFSDPDLFDRLYLRPQRGWNRLLNRSRIVRLLLFFQRMLGTFRPVSGSVPHPTDATLLAAFTDNQWRAMDPINKALQRDNVAVSFFDGRQTNGFLRLLARRSFLWALPFFPWLLMRMLATRGYQWKSFLWGIDRYWHAYGAYVATRRWLRQERPRTVIVSNDHNFWPRILVAAAKDEGIPTIYIQHAPVTDRFPPLTMDYALLEGRQSLETYATIGKSSTKVYLIGMPRLDQYVAKLNQRTKANAVGLCLSLNDSQDRALKLIQYLSSHCQKLRLVLRLHPRSSAAQIAFWKETCRELDVDYSDSREEHPFELLVRVDVVIAGGSGIILEAALQNVTPIMYELTLGIPDWYGFASDGLCPMFYEPQPLVEMLNELAIARPSIRARMTDYCATIGTSYDGRSSELAATIIRCIVAASSPPRTDWRPIAESGLTAYELALGATKLAGFKQP